jgi:single-strand DNA-binding protein
MKSLNKVILIGNLTRDPELRYTPNGSAVTGFSIATNRTWKDSTGQQKEEVDFHRIVAWTKLAEICSQYLHKGTKVYIEGRLQNHKYTDKQGQEKSVTEIIANDMIILTNKNDNQHAEIAPPEPDTTTKPAVDPVTVDPDPNMKLGEGEEVDPSDIPF